jgi:hypothetical protein
MILNIANIVLNSNIENYQVTVITITKIPARLLTTAIIKFIYTFYTTKRWQFQEIRHSF